MFIFEYFRAFLVFNIKNWPFLGINIVYTLYLNNPVKNERDFKRILTRLLFKCIYTRLTVCENAFFDD